MTEKLNYCRPMPGPEPKLYACDATDRWKCRFYKRDATMITECEHLGLTPHTDRYCCLNHEAQEEVNKE